MNWDLLWNSLMVALPSAAAALLLGGLAALAVVSMPARGQHLILAASALAFMWPPFLVVNAWLDLFGPDGPVRGWLPFPLHSVGGVILLLSLLYWPITLWACFSAWHNLDAAWLEHDPALTGPALLRWLLWPAARRAALLGAIIILVLSLNHFSIPALLQVPVLPADIWLQFNTTFDYGTALLHGWPLLAGPALLLLAWRHAQPCLTFDRGHASPHLWRERLGPRLLWGSRIALSLTLLASVALPAAHLLANERSWTELGNVLQTSAQPAWNSLSGSALAALLCLGLGILLWPYRLFGLVWMTFLTPGILIGIGLILCLNRPAFSWIYPSAGTVLLAWSIRYVAPCWHWVRQAMLTTDPDLAEAARLQGASRWQILLHVEWPQVSTKAWFGAYLVYLFCLWDVETLTMIVPPGGETLSLRIFNLLHYGHNSQVNALGLVLLGLALLPLLPWALLRTLPFRGQRLSTILLPVLLSPLLGGCTPAPTTDNANLGGRFFTEARLLGSRGTAVGQFNKPRSLATDQHDQLYVADMTGRIQKFSPSGQYLLSWYVEQTDRGKPKGMGRDADGNIVVIEPHYARINHYDTNGWLVTRWGEFGTNDGYLTLPRAVATTAQGNLYVSEYTRHDRVQLFSATNHAWLQTLGRSGSGPGEFNRPEGLAIDPHGQLYVADSCNHRIQVFRPDGTWLTSYGEAGSGPGQLSYPCDIQIDADGNQFVCEFGNSRIQVFGPDHQSLEIVGGPGAEPGRFSNPWGITLDSKGNLYVADSGNHRVQKLIRTSQDLARLDRPSRK